MKTGSIIQLCYLTLFLRKHCEAIGQENYEISLIRQEHGTGTGFGAVSNSGSWDCLKEQLRNIGVQLGARFDRIEQIHFKTQQGISITQSKRNKNNFRVEHTIELTKDLFPMYEQEFIINGKTKISPKQILEWITEHHIVVGIHPSEQINGNQGTLYRKNSFEYPFLKYSQPVFYKNTDVSHYTYEQLKKINLKENPIPNLDYDLIEKQAETRLLESGNEKPITEGHKVPSLELANRLYDDEIALLNEWYVYKKSRLFDGSKWGKSAKAIKIKSMLNLLN